MKYTIPYKKIRRNACAPFHAHDNDAGWDLSVSKIRLDDTGRMITYGCGLAFDFSSVGFADVRSRSSVYKHNLMLSNGVGTIDAGYRGEVTGVFYLMHGDCKLYRYGDRFLQLVFPNLSPDDTVEFVEVESLNETSRGVGGYGSTGEKSK